MSRVIDSPEALVTSRSTGREPVVAQAMHCARVVMYRALWLGFLLSLGCAGGVIDGVADVEVDSSVDTPGEDAAADPADADPGAPDARPGAPDARPGAPDARPAPPDARPLPPDAMPPPPDAAPPVSELAAGIDIGEVAVYQGIKVAVARDGSPVSQRAGPVVAGADSMFGVFVEPAGGFQSRQIRAVVTIDGVEFTETRTITGATGSDPNQNGFTIDVPGAALSVTSEFSVELREVGGATYPGSTAGARYPAGTGDAPLSADSANGALELVIVPFAYNADGSGRLPPLDAATVAEYERLFEAMFPVAEVNITVRQAVPYNSRISAQTGWQAWLDRLTQIRAQDGVAGNVYYYGVAAPATSFSRYCSGGCILGLGYVPGRTNSRLFTSVGVSFPNAVGIFTALHEVGHTMGRRHSPCGGVSGADPAYPHAGGRIGVWGYDASRDQLKEPNGHTDVMGYCRDQWISDFTYNAIFDRVSYVNQAFLRAPAGPPEAYRVGLVDGSGQVTWTRTEVLPYRPEEGDQRIRFLDAGGREVGVTTGYLFGYDHLPGGALYVPLGAASAAAPVTVDIPGVGRARW